MYWYLTMIILQTCIISESYQVKSIFRTKTKNTQNNDSSPNNQDMFLNKSVQFKSSPIIKEEIDFQKWALKLEQIRNASNPNAFEEEGNMFKYSCL